VKTTRREFVSAGGSLLVYFALPGAAFAQSSSADPGKASGQHGNEFIDTWVRIESGGKVVISVGKVEFGQGIRTALAQIAAEELDVDFSRIQMAEVDTSYSPDEFYTFSAISIQQSGGRVQKACAQARQILMQLAADELAVETSGLSVSDGVILDKDQATTVNYWSLLEDKHFDAVVPDDVVVKNRKEYKLVGQPVQRLDIPTKVYAQASYLCDMRLPDMVHARLVRPPRTGLRLLSSQTGGVGSLPGVIKAVQDGSFLAVLAEREQQAVNAAKILAATCRWETAVDQTNNETISTWLKTAPAKSYPVASRGSGENSNVTRTFSAQYTRPFIAHASIAPSSAIALWDENNLSVWSHGQGMYPLRGAIAGALGLTQDQVRCIHVESGGVYGHNGADDAACDAAVCAMSLPGRPVKLQWSRTDEFCGEPYGSAMAVSTKAGLDQNGRIVNWQQEVWSGAHSTRPGGLDGAGNLLYAQQKADPLPAPPLRSLSQPTGGADRNSIPIYDIPEMEVSKHLVETMPLRVSALRSLGAYTNVLAIESFMDELAIASKTDPFDFRLAHLSDERARGVLSKLRDQSGWKDRPTTGSGQGWGLGFAKYKNLAAYTAVVIKLEVSADGEVRLKSARAVVDAGLVVNPDGVRAQIEGGIVQACSWTLKEQVNYQQDAILSTDWSTYPILSFVEVPDVNVDIIDQGDHAWMGVAEAAQGPAAAAIANAVAHACGVRVRNTPITAGKIRAGLS
jgi:nicotinate dehydrogenase subunit B